jgi:uncharacterized protein with WD repeat
VGFNQTKASVSFYEYPNLQTPYYVSKKIEKAHEIITVWSPNGENCLLWTQTLFDEKNESYYGEHKLYMFNVSGVLL